MTRRSRPQFRSTRPQLESLETKQLLTTFAVTNVADSGTGSLRQAILNANADTGTTGETINFAIPGSGTHTITPATPLPAITQSTVVDATTQPGYAGTPLVVLDGINAVDPSGKAVAGLQVTYNGFADSTIAGLEIVRFSGSGIVTAVPFTAIHNDLIGTNAAGDDLGNGSYGIWFAGGYSKSVGDSVIEYNGLEAFGIGWRLGTLVDPDGFITQNVVNEHNNAQATSLLISTPTAVAPNAYSGPTTYTHWDSDVTLTYVITNTGAHAAKNVSIDLSQNWLYRVLTVTGATTSQGTVNPSTLDANSSQQSDFADLGTIAPGASVTLTITAHVGAKPDDPNEFGQLTVIANSPQLDYNSTSAGTYNIDAVDSFAPQLAITTPAGTYDDEYVAFGSVQPLTYTVTNTGSADATGVSVSFAQAAFSHLISVNSVTTTQGTVIPGFNLDDANNTVSIGTLAPGASATITIMGQVGATDDTDGKGDIINAVVTSDQSPATTTTPPTNALYTLTPNADGVDPNPVLLEGTTFDGLDSTSTTTTSDAGTVAAPTAMPVAVLTAQPILRVLPTIAFPTPADLVISGTAPTLGQAGSASLFLMTVRNNGGTTATDAVAALNLGALPAGSFYSILTQGSNGAPARVTPWAGRPGVYLVDLGSLAAGASAVVDVMVIPTTNAPLTLVMAASDATAPTLDPNPGDNVVYLGSTGTATATATTPTTTATMVSPSVVQVATTSTVTRTAAADLAHYQLTTTTGGDSKATTVKLRSASYNATTHRVTLRLAHPLPSSATQAQLAVTGLGSTGTSTLNLTRG